MPTKDSNNPLRVLIAGAGIAGLATAIALRRISNINVDVQLYERARELKEIGASIALSPNGLRTLEKLSVHNALDDDVAFRGPSGIPMIYRHWKTSRIVSYDSFVNVPLRRHQTARFHRAHLHQALLKHVPRDIIHLGKKVVRAEVRDERVVVFFADGTSAEGDVLIGADGIRSKVRQSFAPDHRLRWTGRIFMRSTFDASLVEGKVPDLPPDSTHWWGPRENFFASKLGKNQFTVVGSYIDKRSPEELERQVSWDQEGDIKLLRERYRNWNPTVKALVDRTPYTRLYPNYAGDPLPTWTFGSRVTLVGDAAHTHGGAFAAGGSLALDDAYALALAFRHVFGSASSANVPLSPAAAISKALNVYGPNAPATCRATAEDRPGWHR
ncbi:hypothetical protein T310_10161 [Rasamsonia emersonii CBS 393.64]|uniref:FAD-binding domain-containing protein n=1 Tax=Rasamsonia emersonii (strain ATCC 16479 / CBS 393.64 / IMI 116815) TaxID=1408163 RepID=A0A0F4YDK2_RASE3|nr:hypothetical protein T310_10161 [Rasamsonia emersonii CBS 393.64]KKA16259.1 hypothetical protein T310_10161 [Rasamsonia emersonii CBS 393.64]